MSKKIRKPIMVAVGGMLAAAMFFSGGAADAATKKPVLQLATPVAASHEMVLHWVKVKHVDKYKIAYSSSKHFTHRKTVSTKQQYATVKSLTNGVKYYVQVFALRSSHRIAVSAVKSVTPHANTITPPPVTTTGTLAAALQGGGSWWYSEVDRWHVHVQQFCDR